MGPRGVAKVGRVLNQFILDYFFPKLERHFHESLRSDRLQEMFSLLRKGEMERIMIAITFGFYCFPWER